MRKLSMMTISMFFQMYSIFTINKDREELVETYEEMMELIHDTGYETVDITSIEIQALGLDKVKEVLDNNGLQVSSYIHFDTYADMEKSRFTEHIENGKRAVDITKAMKCKTLMLVPQAQESIEEYSREQIWKQFISYWNPIVAYASIENIHCVVEDTPDLRLSFCTMDEMEKVLEAVPGLEIVYDSGNMLLVGEDPVEYYEKFADKVKHIHIKDMRYANIGEVQADIAKNGRKMTVAPTGMGLVDIPKVLESVRAHHYDGYLTVEFTLDDNGDYKRSLIRSKNFLQSLL